VLIEWVGVGILLGAQKVHVLCEVSQPLLSRGIFLGASAEGQRADRGGRVRVADQQHSQVVLQSYCSDLSLIYLWFLHRPGQQWQPWIDPYRTLLSALRQLFPYLRLFDFR
jgi:hypothetical protein